MGFAVIGDMSSRPNWGLYELDFVFSTLVVRNLQREAQRSLEEPASLAAIRDISQPAVNVLRMELCCRAPALPRDGVASL